jgi:hypothetical protein
MIIVQEDKYIIELNTSYDNITGYIVQLDNMTRLGTFNIILSKGRQNLSIEYSNLDNINIVNSLVLKIFEKYGKNY